MVPFVFDEVVILGDAVVLVEVGVDEAVEVVCAGVE
jgi:hypothetical protein